MRQADRDETIKNRQFSCAAPMLLFRTWREGLAVDVTRTIDEPARGVAERVAGRRSGKGERGVEPKEPKEPKNQRRRGWGSVMGHDSCLFDPFVRCDTIENDDHEEEEEGGSKLKGGLAGRARGSER